MIKCDAIVKDKRWHSYFILKHYFKNRIKKINKYTFFKKNNYEFSVLLSNNKHTRKLNQKFRKKNKSSDVLSFPNFSKIKLKKNYSKMNTYLGDIVISYEKILKKEFTSHLDKLWIHGLLHLLGHSHKSEKNYKKMQKLENALYKLIYDI